MENFITEKGTYVPYVNLNGNSKEDLIESLYQTGMALEKAYFSLIGTDFNHGRNAVSPDHALEMTMQKGKHIKALSDTIQYIDDILYKISE